MWPKSVPRWPSTNSAFFSAQLVLDTFVSAVLRLRYFFSASVEEDLSLPSCWNFPTFISAKWLWRILGCCIKIEFYVSPHAIWIIFFFRWQTVYNLITITNLNTSLLPFYSRSAYFIILTAEVSTFLGRLLAVTVLLFQKRHLLLQKEVKEKKKTHMKSS